MGALPADDKRAPTLSVVIPVYDPGKYLVPCLESVLGSSFADLEIICVDDGSTDGSADVLRAYAERDERVRVIVQEHQSVGIARNRGIETARGTYIHFLDADDWVSRDAYGPWCSLAQAHEAEVCECLYECVNADTGVMVTTGAYRTYPRDGGPVVTSVDQDPQGLVHGHMVPWNKIYLRSFLLREGIRFDDLVCAEDRSFYFDALFKARRYVRTDARWVVHRVGIPTSLDGSDVRLRNFEVEFRSFELIWSRVQDATEEQRLLVLESCIGDSLYYFRRAYDTEYELPLARMLYDYWHDYLQLLGNISGRHWYVDVARMIADCQQPAYRRLLLDLLDRYEEDRRYQHRLDWLKHKVLLGAEDTARAALGLWQRIPLPWRRRGSA